jgi:hypothetical protein
MLFAEVTQHFVCLVNQVGYEFSVLWYTYHLIPTDVGCEDEVIAYRKTVVSIWLFFDE